VHVYSAFVYSEHTVEWSLTDSIETRDRMFSVLLLVLYSPLTLVAQPPKPVHQTAECGHPGKLEHRQSKSAILHMWSCHYETPVIVWGILTTCWPIKSQTWDQLHYLGATESSECTPHPTPQSQHVLSEANSTSKHGFLPSSNHLEGLI